MALLGHAASAEDGSGFGIKGDQTGREVRIDTLGSDGNKWVWIYRYPIERVAYNIAEAARQCCMNDNIGYSRGTSSIFGINSTRYGLWEEMMKTGDIRKIKEQVNCDCSSMVISCIYIAGVPYAENHKEMYTAIEDSVLTILGFTRIPYDLKAVRKGDVLWREGHTGIVIEGNENSGPSKTPKYVEEATTLVNVRTEASGSAPNLKEYPRLGEGNKVDFCDSKQVSGGAEWHYVRIAGRYYGWVNFKYLKRV